MGSPDLGFERAIDLPRGIVWSALVDPELLVGWLGEATIEGTAFSIRWLDRVAAPLSSGRVDATVEDERIELTVDGVGSVSVRLDNRPGGLRGTWTALSLRCPSTIGPAAVELALDRLEELLRGHPVDWAAIRKGPGGIAHLSKFRNIR